MPLNYFAEHEFSPDLAGKRVGWTSMVEGKGDRKSLLGVNVVVATVGNEGARHGYLRDGRGERLYSASDTEGFIAVSGLFVLIERGRSEPGELDTIYYAQKQRDEAVGSIFRGAIGSSYFLPGDNDREWADNGEELIGHLKGGLESADAEQHYPEIYYQLNGNMGHGAHREGTVTQDTPLDELLIADKDMLATTRRQIVYSGEIIDKLTDAQTEDELMETGLTVFSGILPKNVPDAFRASRLTVSSYEKSIGGVLPKLLASKLVYLPVGAKREWPYMDPGVTDEYAAFGRELDALRARNIVPASSELGRELKELEKRQKYAKQGNHVLRSLASMEQAA